MTCATGLLCTILAKLHERETAVHLSSIYYEACLNEQDAFRREKYLKTTYGKRYLKSRCRNYFTG